MEDTETGDDSFQGYRPRTVLSIARPMLLGGSAILSLILSAGFLASIGQRGQSDLGSATAGGVCLIAAAMFTYLALRRRPRDQLPFGQAGARLDVAGLPSRAQRAARALQEATGLVEELKSELDARTALLADVRRQVDETSLRASEMQKLAQVDTETSKIINKYLAEALNSKFEAFEQSARRREWLLGTLVAFFIGIAAILISHYFFGF